MKTVIIKNLSSIWDESAVFLCELHIRTNRDKEYSGLLLDATKRHNVNVKIEESEVDNKITYTVTDAECEQ